MTLKKEFEEVLAYYKSSTKAGDIEPGTVRVLEQAFSKLCTFWNEKEPSEITRANWESYLDLFEIEFPGASMFNVKKYMGVLISHLLEKGLISKRPSIRDRNAKRDREKRKHKKSRVLTDDEILALESACESQLEKLALKFGYQMGFRISDVCKVSWERIVWSAEVPYIRFTEGDDKAGLDAVCPISGEIEEILLAMQPDSFNKKWIFPMLKNSEKHWKPQSLDAIWRKIKRRAKLAWPTFHSLRHKCLTRDFKDRRFTALQVCKMRRVSMKIAEEHYVHSEMSDLALLKDSGKIERQS
jgi:integrase